MGRFLYRCRWFVLSAWVALAAGLIVLGNLLPKPAEREESFLPGSAASIQATAAIRKAFPGSTGLSEAVVVFERRDGALTSADRAVIDQFTDAIHADAKLSSAGLNIQSPEDLAAVETLAGRNPLVSKAASGQAALIMVNIPGGFITRQAAGVADRIRTMLVESGRRFPAGLAAYVTGSAAFGSDYAAAAKASQQRTMWVSLAAVLAILLLVYRSPIAAAVPLAAIALAGAVAMCALGLLERVGLHVGTAERIFVVVLLYGSGTDYAMLLISRYREFLDDGLTGEQALPLSWRATRGAILASGGTDAAGLMMLCFATYTIFKTTGQAVAVALAVAMLAVLTLVPAMAAVVGRWMFWPGHKMGSIGQRRLWPAVARLVIARPKTVLLATLVVLAIPATRSLSLQWVYDTLSDLPNSYQAVQGTQAVRRHWPVGAIAPVTLLVQSSKPLDPDGWREAMGKVATAASAVPGVREVMCLTSPLGRGASVQQAMLLQQFGAERIQQQYIGDEGRASRMTVILDCQPLTLEAMDVVDRLRTAAQSAVGAELDARVHVAGTTAYTMDIRQVTHKDFRLIAVLVLGVVFAMVFLLLRDVLVSAFLVAGTALSYMAALGVTYWLFAGILGAPGLDWKVEVFLFVVMVAVGVDYSIFLAARVFQEARTTDIHTAVSRAVVATGPVISSCGAIMAATLGSLAAGDLALMKQLGAAFAIGMLMDTFVVRPLLLPAFIAAVNRKINAGASPVGTIKPCSVDSGSPEDAASAASVEPIAVTSDSESIP